MVRAMPDRLRGTSERQQQILKYVRDRQSVTNEALAAALKVSEATVRRDLQMLEDADLLRRTHGGAALKTAPPGHYQTDFEIGPHLGREVMEPIAHEAAKRVQPHATVVFDCTGLAFETARVLVRQRMPMTAVTIDLRVALELARGPSVRVVVPGGTSAPGSIVLLGEPGNSFLERLHADVAFISTYWLKGDRLYATSVDIAETRRRMIAAAERRILLTSHSSFAAKSFCEVAHVRQMTEVICDHLPDDARTRFSSYGLAVTAAAEAPGTPRAKGGDGAARRIRR
jgi:DeoR family transcriptional regulator of aga operon